MDARLPRSYSFTLNPPNTKSLAGKRGKHVPAALSAAAVVARLTALIHPLTLR